MTDALYLRIKSLNTRTVRGVTSPKNIVRVAALHNLREIQAELGASASSGINPARMHLNYQLRGPTTADEVASLALALLDNAGVQSLRRDACMALELVVSVPADTTIDHRAYFSAAVAWADAHFNVPILSAAVHLDEAAPHCHILLLPLVGGRMQGGALAGGPSKIRAMLADFQQQVAQRFGITHQPRAKRLSRPNRDAAGRMLLDALRARPERLRGPAMHDALIAALGSQAETLLALLGLSMPTTKAKAKSFADIMTAPCKPEREHRAAPNTKHIDVAQNLGNQESKKFDNVYLCVDIAPSPSPNPAHEQPLPPVTEPATRGKDRNISGQSQSSRPNIVRWVEQRQGDADQRQQSTNASTALRAPIQAVTLAQAAAGNLSDTPAAPAGQGDQPDEIRRVGVGAAPLRPSSAIRTIPTHVHAQPGITENTESGVTSAPTPTPTPASGGSLRSARPPHPKAGSGDHQRQRDNDHPATSWDEQRGEFAQATGPPRSPCHLYT